MIVRSVSIALLAVLAVALGANLLSASSRFVQAHDTYARIDFELSSFEYTSPDEPMLLGFVVNNPTSRDIEVIEIEVNVNLGIHRVGGGIVRPLATLPVGESLETSVTMPIFDADYVRRRATDEPDWRLTGRVMVRIDPVIDPEWIPFTVRRLPE